MRSIVVLAACLFCTVAHAGEVYKWKDKDGHTHYGDKPKIGGEEVEIRGTGGKGPPLHDPTEVAAQTARDAECKRKKEALDLYRSAPSVNETDAQGKTREYSGAEKQALLDRTEKEMTAACAPTPAR